LLRSRFAQVLSRSGTRALASSVLVLTVVSACAGGTASPTPAPLSDPRQILTQSLVNLSQAKSFHVAGTIAGSVDMNGLSSLGGSSSLGLTGTLDLKGGTITGDVDVSRQAAHLTVSFPSLFGLTVDLIEVDGYSYTKINLMSDKYTKSKTDVGAIAGAVPGASADVGGVVAGLQQMLDGSGATATLTGHSNVDGKDCYQLNLAIATDQLNAGLQSLAPSLSGNPGLDSASAGYWVYGDTLRPAQVELKVSSASLGNVDVTATLTRYDQSVSITAPPADQVEAQ
jgi:hypothetical protein